MKKGQFITDRNLIGKPMSITWDEVWGDPTGNRRRNSKNLQPETGNGLLMVRGKFHLKPGEKATIRVTALGTFDVCVNGQRIGTEELKPEWTDYRFRIFEYEYDITHYCRTDNIITAVVGNGWYGSRIGYHLHGDNTAFVCEVETDSGIYASDETWETCVGGRITFSDIYDGEHWNLTLPDVHTESDRYTWNNAILHKGFTGRIIPHIGPYVRMIEKLNISPDKYVLYDGITENGSDFGEIHPIEYKGRIPAGCILQIDGEQNTVGRPRIRFSAKRGTVIKVYFAEMLNHTGNLQEGNDGPMGSLYMVNYRSALARMIITANGDGVEECAAVHTFFGYRYIEIEASDDVEIHDVVFEFIGSDLEETGTFVSDSADINKLYSNCVWGMRGNYLSVPTDCPQRDERWGWTGDTLAFIGAASYIADVRSFMDKWLGDMRDSQIGTNGLYSNVAPRLVLDPKEKWGYGGSAAWTDAGILVPYALWKKYNATDLIREHYDSMEEYIACLLTMNPIGPVADTGDWLATVQTDWQYIADCYFLRDLAVMAEMGKEVRPGRVQYYNDLYDVMYAKWREKYIWDGQLIYNSQCALVLALRFSLVAGDERENCIRALEKSIIDAGRTLTTGFVGTSHICPTLSDCGLDELAYDLLFSHEYPGWLFSVDQGATTMWERWNSFTLKDGFGDAGMNSFNHYAYGAVIEWFYSGICGIKPAGRGFEHFLLEPVTDPKGRMNYAKATYCGIVSEWEREGDRVTYRFTVPTHASMVLRGRLINGIGAEKDGRITAELPAGEYVIVVSEK